MSNRSSDDRRHAARFDTLNLLDFTAFNSIGEPVARGMGRTLNVSMEGILLETTVPLEKDQQVAVWLGIEEKLVEIQGRVMHVVEGQEGRCHAGIKFRRVKPPEAKGILQAYLDLFSRLQPAS